MSCVAVIPARRAERTIGATLESLRLGNASFVAQVVVVTSEGDPTARVVEAWAARDRRVHLVKSPEPLSAGAARNAGRRFLAAANFPVNPGQVRISAEIRTCPGLTGGLLLFVDADCRLETGGAARLAAELLGSGAAAVSARVAGHGGAVARTRHILEFKEAASRRRPPSAWLPPTTTMMCRTAAFDRVGGFRDMWPGEDLIFSQSLRDLGEEVRRSDGVVTEHLHPRGTGEMLRHQYRLGYTAALARRATLMPGSRIARLPLLAPLLLPARIARIAAWQAREGRSALVWTLWLSPLLVAGLARWTAGFAAGARAPLDHGHASPRDVVPSTPSGGDGDGARTVAVVPVFNGAGILGDCLDALLASRDESFGIVVVDDGSHDASVAVARERAARSGGRIEVLTLGRNYGFAGAVNRAVASILSRAQPPEFLALVNQDCFVSRDWLAPLVAALADPGVGLVGARLHDLDGVTLQHAGARIETNALTTHLGRGCTDPRAWRTAGPVDYVCGALVALRSETWRRLGPFDEGYAPAYYEEVDYSVRARRAGLRSVYVPDSQARHVEASCSGAMSRLFLRRYHRSRLRFVVRHHAREVGLLRWIAAEAAWLLRQRCWRDAAPALAAYASVPRFWSERMAERAGEGVAALRRRRAGAFRAAVVEVSR
ncbi:MAG: glycosyltransferase [Candidatus Binatia bacterium]